MIASENNFRVLEKLYFVKFRYLGDSVKEAVTEPSFTKSSIFFNIERFQ